MSILVKLLSGTQTGAEVALVSGTYILGSGDDADLVLADAAVLPRHASLTVGEGEIWEIAPIDDARVCVDGQDITGPVPLKPYQVITLGGVHIAIGPNGRWPALPAIPAPAAAKPEVPAAHETPPASAAEPASPSPDSEAPAVVPEEGATPKKTSAMGVVSVMIAVLALAAVAWGVYWRYVSPSTGFAVARALEKDGVAVRYPFSEKDGELPRGTVGVALGDDGTIRVSGLLRGQAEKAAVLSSPALSGRAVEDGIATVEETVDAVNRRIAREYPGAALETSGDGWSARLDGLVKGRDAVAGAYRLTRESLDSRIAIHRNLGAWSDLRRDMEIEASRLGLAGMRFDLSDGRVQVIGDPWPDETQRETLVDFIRQRYGSSAAGLFSEAFASPPIAVHQAPSLTVDEPPIEDGPGASDENAFSSGEESKAAGVRQWEIQRIESNGFVDQNDVHYKVGDYISSNLRLVGVWGDGIMVQRGNETLLGGIGSVIVEENGKKTE